MMQFQYTKAERYLLNGLLAVICAAGAATLIGWGYVIWRFWQAGEP